MIAGASLASLDLAGPHSQQRRERTAGVGTDPDVHHHVVVDPVPVQQVLLTGHAVRVDHTTGATAAARIAWSNSDRFTQLAPMRGAA